MSFCILEGMKPPFTKSDNYVEIESINPRSIENFKNSIQKADIFSKLNREPNANPNDNYNILTSILTTSKNNHIPKKIKKFNKRKHKKENWMTDELLILVNRKNDMYRDWKSTSNDYEYQIKED